MPVRYHPSVTDAPRDASQTPREALRAALEAAEMTVRELSEALRTSEREVVDHLGHLDKSVRADGKVLRIGAPVCLQCDFEFDGRTRFKRPGKCPQCRSTRISYPTFHVS